VAALEVTVNGEAWVEVEDLTHSGPNDRHYVVDRKSGDAGEIHFGDGVTGAKPPSGATFGLKFGDWSEPSGKAPGFYTLRVPDGGTVQIHVGLSSGPGDEERGRSGRAAGCLALIMGVLAAIFMRRSRK
jgi:hypothetical protein